VTQMATAALLFGAGDVLCQQGIERKGAKHDYLRTARLSAYGGFLFAPVVATWYRLLERVPVTQPRARVLAKVGLDQFVLTPGLVTMFFGSMTFMEGKGPREVVDRLRVAWLPTLVKNWGVFIPTQLLNFSVVPLQHRLLVVNVVSLFWNCYLSYANQVSQQMLQKASSSAASPSAS